MTGPRTAQTPHTPSAAVGVAGAGHSESPAAATPLRIVGVCGLVVVSGTPDQRLATLADAQWGRVSREQLLAIGFTPGMIKARLRSGALRLLHRGVYGIGHRVRTELGAEVAALLACGSARTALSHHTAALLWEIIDRPPNDVHMTLLGGARCESRIGIVVHRSRSLTKADLGRRRELPVTTAARTLVDMTETCTAREVERAFDEALARRLVRPASLREAIARAPGRRGTALLEALLEPARARGVTRGHAEERMLELLRAAGIPDPQRNVAIGPYVVDFLWREARLVIEVDSYTWHSSSRAFKRDRRKDAFLADRGLTVVRVTWEMMDQPLPLIARIARAIAPR